MLVFCVKAKLTVDFRGCRDDVTDRFDSTLDCNYYPLSAYYTTYDSDMHRFIAVLHVGTYIMKL